MVGWLVGWLFCREGSEGAKTGATEIVGRKEERAFHALTLLEQKIEKKKSRASPKNKSNLVGGRQGADIPAASSSGERRWGWG